MIIIKGKTYLQAHGTFLSFLYSNNNCRIFYIYWFENIQFSFCSNIFPQLTHISLITCLICKFQIIHIYSQHYVLGASVYLHLYGQYVLYVLYIHLRRVFMSLGSKMMTVFPTPGSWSLRIIIKRINTSYLYAIKGVLQKQQLKRYMYEKEVIVKIIQV